jgi:Leucine-rich repeat (LRR) protein
MIFEYNLKANSIKRLILLIGGMIFMSSCMAQVGGSDTITLYMKYAPHFKLKKIPSEVFDMPNLKHLRITGMDCDATDESNCWTIQVIPRDIKRLKKLRILELSLNQIRELPEELGSLNELRALDLTDNGISNIDCVTRLQNLEELSLFGCALTKLPKDIGNLKKLKYLGIKGNPIDAGELKRIRQSLPNCEIIF